MVFSPFQNDITTDMVCGVEILEAAVNMKLITGDELNFTMPKLSL